MYGHADCRSRESDGSNTEDDSGGAGQYQPVWCTSISSCSRLLGNRVNLGRRMDHSSHGTVFHGMAWHGMAWHGMAWHGKGMAWHGMAWHSMVRAWHGTVRCGTARRIRHLHGMALTSYCMGHRACCIMHTAGGRQHAGMLHAILYASHGVTTCVAHCSVYNTSSAGWKRRYVPTGALVRVSAKARMLLSMASTSYCTLHVPPCMLYHTHDILATAYYTVY